MISRLSRNNVVAITLLGVSVVSVLFIIYCWFGVRLLRYGNGIGGWLGRESVGLRINLGLAGPEFLLCAQDEAIRSWTSEHEHDDIVLALAIVRTGYQRLSCEDKARFIRKVEKMMVQGPPADVREYGRYAFWLEMNWGYEVSRETILQACSSDLAGVRQCGINLLGIRHAEFSKADVEPIARQLFGHARKSGDEDMMRDSLVLAKDFSLLSFLREQQDEIREMASSQDCLTRYLAKLCLKEVEGSGAVSIPTTACTSTVTTRGTGR